MRATWTVLLLIWITFGARLASANERWYQVETIVFRYVAPIGAEQLPRPSLSPDFSGAINLLENENIRTRIASEDMDASAALAFEPLPRRELKLAGVYRRLANHPNYETLMHVGWRQSASEAGRARRVYLSDAPQRLSAETLDVQSDDILATSRPHVEGTVRIKISRILQLEADFYHYSADTFARIHEWRKVKLKELHYFDNPEFGVIIQITPVLIVTDDAQN